MAPKKYCYAVNFQLNIHKKFQRSDNSFSNLLKEALLFLIEEKYDICECYQHSLTLLLEHIAKIVRIAGAKQKVSFQRAQIFTHAWTRLSTTFIEFQQLRFVQVSWHAIFMITPVLCHSSTTLFVVFTMFFGKSINI